MRVDVDLYDTHTRYSPPCGVIVEKNHNKSRKKNALLSIFFCVKKPHFRLETDLEMVQGPTGAEATLTCNKGQCTSLGNLSFIVNSSSLLVPSLVILCIILCSSSLFYF